MPFWSLVLVFIGGQAVGMRSMAIYELGSDYVNYGRGLGVSDGITVRYIFRNAMLPQITGLALSIAGIITGGLITELVFSYPGLGTLLFNAIGQNDYPVIQAITLLITLAVLIANFAVDIAHRLHRSADPGRTERRALMSFRGLSPRFWVAADDRRLRPPDRRCSDRWSCTPTPTPPSAGSTTRRRAAGRCCSAPTTRARACSPTWSTAPGPR